MATWSEHEAHKKAKWNVNEKLRKMTCSECGIDANEAPKTDKPFFRPVEESE